MVRRISGIVLGLVAALHLVRAIMGWDLLISNWSFPIWGSWIAGILLAWLARANLCKT